MASEYMQERHYQPVGASATDKSRNNAVRAVSVGAGALLAVYGLRHFGLRGLVAGGAGALLVMRGLRGGSAGVEQRAEETTGAAQMKASLTIARSPREVYEFFKNFENLPQFLRHVQSVSRGADGRYHWVAKPAVPKAPVLEWDSEITADREGQELAWRSVPQSRIETHGRVQFRQAPGNRGTEVHLTMSFTPPKGRLLARMMRPVSEQLLKEDMRRLKRLLETGEIPSTDGQPVARAA